MHYDWLKWAFAIVVSHLFQVPKKDVLFKAILHLFIYVCTHTHTECVYTHCVWLWAGPWMPWCSCRGQRTTLSGVSSPLNHVGPGDRIRVIRPGDRYLYPLSHHPLSHLPALGNHGVTAAAVSLRTFRLSQCSALSCPVPHTEAVTL